jgi:DNA modification methylase
MLSTDKVTRITDSATDTRRKLHALIAMDLDFHDEDSSEMTHDFHAFPAKFPPQLPRLFIDQLTVPGERVLDPMMGSGTCIVEAVALGRQGIGFDIDPLAAMLSRVKVTPVDPEIAKSTGLELATRAEWVLGSDTTSLERELAHRFDVKTRQFVDYWFSFQTQLELMALICEIEEVCEPSLRAFLLLAFSAVIITKSGGVSLAWDLAHTRPHKLNQGVAKSYKPAVKEFKKRLLKNVASLKEMVEGKRAFVHFGNAETLPLKDSSIDLLFTSPPYASNAIDYMRAHKFSLVWTGIPLDRLSDLRSKYIGGEKITRFPFVEMPLETQKIVTKITERDPKKGLALLRYYSEMSRVLSEGFRVLKPGKAAIFVVGSSLMRGVSSQTQDCLGEIGTSLGFELVSVGTRKLDRDRRMLPARLKQQDDSQIEVRMHEEFVIALLKPAE